MAGGTNKGSETISFRSNYNAISIILNHFKNKPTQVYTVSTRKNKPLQHKINFRQHEFQSSSTRNVNYNVNLPRNTIRKYKGNMSKFRRRISTYGENDFYKGVQPVKMFYAASMPNNVTQQQYVQRTTIYATQITTTPTPVMLPVKRGSGKRSHVRHYI